MESETVLLTGASGLLGTWLRRITPADSKVVWVSHRRRLPDGPQVAVDLRDRAAVSAAFTRVRPGLVIHAGCARDEASIVDATQNVVEMAHEVAADLVYISSEAVFSGDGLPRDEAARPDPVWDYGRWKASAEASVVQSGDSSVIIRLPLIVSLEPEDHIVARIRAGADAGQPTVWFEDEMRQPAHAEELAAAIWAIAAMAPDDRAGVWHLPGPESLSRYEIAERAASAIGLDHQVIRAAPTPPSARRPRDLELSDGRAREQLDWSPTRVFATSTPRPPAVR